MATGTRAGYYRTGGLLYFKDRLVIPGSLRRELLRRHYNDPRADYGGSARTLDLLLRFYYWEGIADDVKDYVSKCSVCQGNRVPRYKPYGKLKLLPLPTRPWEEIAMDFIINLPPNAGLDNCVYDSILVIINRYTKMALFIPITKTLNAA